MKRTKKLILGEKKKLEQERLALLKGESNDLKIANLRIALDDACVAYARKIRPRLDEIYNLTLVLDGELKAIPSKKIVPSPKLRQWLQTYTSGVSFGAGHDPEFYWVSDDEQYVILRYPGRVGYVDRMTGSKYQPAEYEAIFVTGTTKWTDYNKTVLMHTEGKLLKDQLFQMHTKIDTHRKQQEKKK